MLTRITPALAVAYWVSAHSARFGLHTPTRSPLRRPAASIPPASRSTASPNSRIGVAHTVAAVDERLGVGDAGDRPLEVVPDRLPEQWIRASAVCVGQHLDLHSFLGDGTDATGRSGRRHGYGSRDDDAPSRAARGARGRARGRGDAGGSRGAGGARRAGRGTRRRARRGRRPRVGGRGCDGMRALVYDAARRSPPEARTRCADARAGVGRGAGARHRRADPGRRRQGGADRAPRPTRARSRRRCGPRSRTWRGRCRWSGLGTGLERWRSPPAPQAADDDLAELVCFLVSPAGEYFTGCVFELGLA